MQVESLLERLESGEKVEHVIREEKRRQRKKETKKLKQNKQLKLLGKVSFDSLMWFKQYLAHEIFG